jgi:hypothetical protein
MWGFIVNNIRSNYKALPRLALVILVMVIAFAVTAKATYFYTPPPNELVLWSQVSSAPSGYSLGQLSWVNASIVEFNVDSTDEWVGMQWPGGAWSLNWTVTFNLKSPGGADGFWIGAYANGYASTEESPNGGYNFVIDVYGSDSYCTGIAWYKWTSSGTDMLACYKVQLGNNNWQSIKYVFWVSNGVAYFEAYLNGTLVINASDSSPPPTVLDDSGIMYVAARSSGSTTEFYIMNFKAFFSITVLDTVIAPTSSIPGLIASFYTSYNTGAPDTASWLVYGTPYIESASGGSYLVGLSGDYGYATVALGSSIYVSGHYAIAYFWDVISSEYCGPVYVHADLQTSSSGTADIYRLVSIANQTWSIEVTEEDSISGIGWDSPAIYVGTFCMSPGTYLVVITVNLVSSTNYYGILSTAGIFDSTSESSSDVIGTYYPASSGPSGAAFILYGGVSVIIHVSSIENTTGASVTSGTFNSNGIQYTLSANTTGILPAGVTYLAPACSISSGTWYITPYTFPAPPTSNPLPQSLQFSTFNYPLLSCGSLPSGNYQLSNGVDGGFVTPFYVNTITYFNILPSLVWTPSGYAIYVDGVQNPSPGYYEFFGASYEQYPQITSSNFPAIEVNTYYQIYNLDWEITQNQTEWSTNSPLLCISVDSPGSTESNIELLQSPYWIDYLLWPRPPSGTLYCAYTPIAPTSNSSATRPLYFILNTDTNQKYYAYFYRVATMYNTPISAVTNTLFEAYSPSSNQYLFAGVITSASTNMTFIDGVAYTIESPVIIINTTYFIPQLAIGFGINEIAVSTGATADVPITINYNEYYTIINTPVAFAVVFPTDNAWLNGTILSGLPTTWYLDTSATFLNVVLEYIAYDYPDNTYYTTTASLIPGMTVTLGGGGNSGSHGVVINNVNGGVNYINPVNLFTQLIQQNLSGPGMLLLALLATIMVVMYARQHPVMEAGLIGGGVILLAIGTVFATIAGQLMNDFIALGVALILIGMALWYSRVKGSSGF